MRCRLKVMIREVSHLLASTIGAMICISLSRATNCLVDLRGSIYRCILWYAASSLKHFGISKNEGDSIFERSSRNER